MASASKDSRGRYIVQFSLSGKRRTLGLGRCGDDVAQDYKTHVKAIVSAREHGINPPPGRRWRGSWRSASRGGGSSPTLD